MGGRNGVRITGGVWRGRRVRAVSRVRPTESRVREALFSIWQAELPGARFLDLFAGSGVVGLEAASRGAGSVTLVEGDLKVFKVLRANCRLAPRGRLQMRRLEIPGGLTLLDSGGYDLIFADPPYKLSEYEMLVHAIAPLISENGELAVEHSVRTEVPPQVAGLAAVDSRAYGESQLTLYRFGESGGYSR